MTTYFSHLLFFLVCKLTVFVKTQETETLFQIEDDSQRVERRLINFMHYRQQPVQIFWRKICRKSICNRSQEFRREVCKRIMRYEFYGFEEDRESVGELLSIQRTFTLKYEYHTLDRDQRRITMFWCPAVNHLNLETGEIETFPLFFNISRAKTNNALFLYIQGENLADDPIYPRYYLYDIHFRKIKKLMKNKRSEAASSSVLTVKINAKCQEESVIRNTLEYVEAIKIKHPYRKFAKLFASANVCSIKLTHKIHTCRLVLKHNFPNVELDTWGYKFPRCRKHTFYFDGADHQIETQLRGTIYALPCPPLKYKSIVPSRLIVSPILHFVSSTLQPDSVLLYSRLNKYKHDLQLKCHFDQMQTTQLWVTDLRRSKLLFYPYPTEEGEQPQIFLGEEDYYTDDVSRVDSARGSVRTPSTIEKEREKDEARAESFADVMAEEKGDESDGKLKPHKAMEHVPVSSKSMRVIYNRWFTEYAVVSFRKIRQQKLVYQKFASTHASIDVCNMTNRQKNELCYEFITDYGFAADRSPSDEAINYPCARHEITLSRQEAEYLGPQTFWMWRCLPCSDSRGNKLTFHVDKSHLKDAAIVYKLTRFEGIEFIHPDVFLSHVNRDTLADAEILSHNK